MFDLPSLLLSPTLQYNGVEFEVKNEFHCTVINPKRVATQFPDASEEQIVAFMKERLNADPLEFTRYKEGFYHCKREERQTIVVQVEVAGLSELFEGLRTLPGLAELPLPFPHVTVYKYNCITGIAISSSQVFAELCQPVSAEVQKKLHRELFGTL